MSTPKRQRTSSSSAGKTSAHKTLAAMKDTRTVVDEATGFKALCSCVVNSATSNSPEDFVCLTDLLKSGADPNYENGAVLERTGGYPLHLAVKLNVPAAIEILLNKGASLVAAYEGKTALQLAFENGDEECIAIICSHIGKLEERYS